VSLILLDAWLGHTPQPPAGSPEARLAGNTTCITFVTVGEPAKWRALRDGRR
jgi:hypothetical protein